MTMRLAAHLMLVAAVLTCGSRPAHAEAVIEGTVTLPRDPGVPASKPRYPVAATYTIGPPDPPAAVVYLEGELPAPSARERPAVQMAQRHYQFAPGLLPIRKGSTVAFPNLDDEYHSVFSYSKAKRFDLGRYHKDEKPAALTFEQPGVIKVHCEIHDHMRGTILVLDTPYFQKTDGAGKYRLENVPAGRYRLHAWVDDDTVYERQVEVPSSGTLRVDLPES